MTVEHEVRALLAERFAAVADEASSSGDAAGLLKAGDKLLELLDTLPVRMPGQESGGGAFGDGGDERGRVLGIIHSAPVVGDASDS